MALVSCPECNKEISDKAQRCPHCGYPIAANISKTTEKEEQLCCPKCFSKEIFVDKRGFSGGKAALGSLLIGNIGLLAGTIGSNDVRITCLKCGYKFKIGEAKIFLSEQEYEELERNVVSLLCECKMVEARELYRKTTNCTEYEAVSKMGRLLAKEVPKHLTAEQKAKHDEMFNSKSGCFGVMLLIVTVSSSLLIALL